MAVVVRGLPASPGGSSSRSVVKLSGVTRVDPRPSSVFPLVTLSVRLTDPTGIYVYTTYATPQK